jgi:hypothetical protein
VIIYPWDDFKGSTLGPIECATRDRRPVVAEGWQMPLAGRLRLGGFAAIGDYPWPLLSRIVLIMAPSDLQRDPPETRTRCGNVPTSLAYERCWPLPVVLGGEDTKAKG